jgi:hypothetical protein
MAKVHFDGSFVRSLAKFRAKWFGNVTNFPDRKIARFFWTGMTEPTKSLTCRKASS